MKINIAFMNVFRTQKGKNATMVFQCDNNIQDDLIHEIKNIDAVENVVSINSIAEG